MNKTLKIFIEDYALASFCSGSSYVFGENIHIDALSQALIEGNHHPGFSKAWQEYKSGNKKVMYNVAYNDTRFAKECKVLETSLNKLCNVKYTIQNVWNCDYTFVADEFWFERILIKDGRNYHIAIRPAFRNLRIIEEHREDLPIHSPWGYPCLYQYNEEDKILEARVFILEKTYANHDVEVAFEDFMNNKLDLQRVFLEIVADG